MASSADSYSDTVVYAGFWMRFGAFLIDSILMAVVGGIAGAIMGALIGGYMGASGSSIEDVERAVVVPSYLLGFAINLLYYAGMESSKGQATLGKAALGIKVTDMDGGRISFGRALGRYFAKILSSLILGIGYIMVAFTEKKQGLHDILANTLVVRK